MKLTLAHYRNRFCMFRTYYALGAGKVRADGIEFTVRQVPDPPSHELEESLISGDVDVANLYLPNFLRQKLGGAPLVGLSTEWKSTAKGNGIFVLEDGPIREPGDLEGRLIATHQGVHVFHQYLLRRAYSVDDARLRWEAHPQEELLSALLEGRADAVVLLDQFYFRAENTPGVRRLYSDGEAWQTVTGFDSMIKHMVAVREDLLAAEPGLVERLLPVLRESFAYSEAHLDEVADVFLDQYGGDREALLASARYPRVEFTFTEEEQRIAQAELEVLVEMGRLPYAEKITALFAA